MTCAPSEDSDQPGHLQSDQSLLSTGRNIGSSTTYCAHSEDWSDWGIPRLIWVLAGCTGHFVFWCEGSDRTCHIFWTHYSNLSRDMTKPTKWVWVQRRLRSAWASPQSDQSLRCALNGKLRAQGFFIWTEKTDQTGRMPWLIWVFPGRTLTLLVLSYRGSFHIYSIFNGCLNFCYCIILTLRAADVLSSRNCLLSLKALCWRMPLQKACKQKQSGH